MVESKQKYSLNILESSLSSIGCFDYLIIAVDGREERSTALIRKMPELSSFVRVLVVFLFNISKEDVLNVLINEGEETLRKIVFVEGDKADYIENVTKLRNLLNSMSKEDRVGVDITSMPVPHFFLLLRWLSRHVSRVFVYYTQPKSYNMPSGLFNSYHSTVGPISVSEIAGYSGITAGGEGRALVCILGFDDDLLPAIIQEAGPQQIIAVNGFPSFFPKFKDVSLINNEYIFSGNDYANKLEHTTDMSKYRYVEADNPFEAYNLIEEIKTKHANYCIDIVPLGTKPVALGICIYAIKHSDVRVIYPIPEKFENETTYDSNKTIEYIIDFE